MAVDLVGIQGMNHLTRIFKLTNQDFPAVSNFKQVVSIFNRTGHARFRRGPFVPPPSSSYSQPEPPKDPVDQAVTCSESASKESFSKSITTSSTITSSSSMAVDGSVSNGKQISSALVTPAPAFSSRKPPLPSSHRKRLSDGASLEGSARSHSLSRGCHCCKRRKVLVKREIKRVPAMGTKVDGIPADEYSWRKCGEKPIEGSPYPRVYYKCSSMIGCPARKRVEMPHHDSKALIVTYQGEHRHSHPPAPVPPRCLTIPGGLSFQSK